MIPSLAGKADHGDDKNTWGRRGVVITPGGGGNGSRRNSFHQRLHQEGECDHSGQVGLMTYL